MSISCRFSGIFHPHLSGEGPSLFLSLDNRISWFKIVPPLREGRLVLPSMKSLASLKDLVSFGLVVGNEPPTDSSEDSFDRLKEFRMIKYRILGEIMGVLSKEELRSKYGYTIRSVPEWNTESGMMRPAYYQLLFHTPEEAATMMMKILE